MNMFAKNHYSLWLLAGGLLFLTPISLAGDSSVTAWGNAPGHAFYIAPTGDDARPGTRAQPFATLTRARDAVRRYKADHPEENITVWLRGGVYRLTETVVFTVADSGAPGQRITYAAYPGETPVLCPDVPVVGWKKLETDPPEVPAIARGKLWVAPVASLRKLKARQHPSPTVATQVDRIGRILSLYQGDRRLPRARGKPFVLQKPAQKFTDSYTFAFPPGALRNWPDLSQGEVSLIPRRHWICNLLPLAEVDEGRNLARTAWPATYTLDPGGQGVCHVENVLAVLDEPGEWVLDARTDTLYLWPPDGAPRDIVAPALTELIRVEGKIDYAGPRDEPVRNLVFRGLTFTRADRFPWQGKTGWGLQHDWERFDSPSAMLRFRGAENCEVADCRFTTAGSSGLRFDLHARRNLVEGNQFDHLGGVGILLAGYGPGTKNVNLQNVVQNNWLHHLGEDYHGSPALFVWQSGENRVAHNLLHDLPYAGICVTGRIVWDPDGRAECSQTIRWPEVGGREIARRFRDPQNPYHKLSTWEAREPFLHARNNIVERNDIHDVMQQCGDGNCIYISGAGNGNLILENYCHDCPSPHMNNVIRCDDDQKGTLIKRNIIFRTGGYAEGLMIKGRNVMVENLLVDLRTGGRHRGYIRFYSGDVHGAVIQRNVLYSREKGQHPVANGPTRQGRPGPRFQDTNADYNLYYSTVDPDWGRAHLRAMRPFNVETHSRAADPLFMDLEKGDFRFRPGSPALRLGIDQPVSLAEVGPRSLYRKRWKRR